MNDNEKTYSSIGFQTLRILNRLASDRALRELANEKREDSDGDAARARTDEDREAYQRAYVEQRLRELALWERRISGEKR